MEEEAAEMVRWLRPEFQAARSLFVVPRSFTAPSIEAQEEVGPLSWPTTGIEQIAALLGIFVTGPLSVESAASWFSDPDPTVIQRHLNTLGLMGEVQRGEDGLFRRGEVQVQSASIARRRPRPVQPPWAPRVSHRGYRVRRGATSGT